MRPKPKEILWSPDTAYAIGLITTDGNLSPDGRHFDFTSKDRDLVQTLKKCLGLINRIGTKKNSAGQVYFRIQFGSVIFYKWLVNIGLMPNKSKRLKSLKILKHVFFDFLRGHLDGDRSIKRYNDPVYPKSIRLYVT